MEMNLANLIDNSHLLTKALVDFNADKNEAIAVQVAKNKKLKREIEAMKLIRPLDKPVIFKFIRKAQGSLKGRVKANMILPKHDFEWKIAEFAAQDLAVFRDLKAFNSVNMDEDLPSAHSSTPNSSSASPSASSSAVSSAAP